MRAAVITEPGGPEVLKVRELPDPVPGPDDVLVDIKASALNRADTLQRQGGYPAPPGSPDDIPGLEFYGVVAQAGANVPDLSPGDRVFGLWAAAPEVFFMAYDALFNHCELSMGKAAPFGAAVRRRSRRE